MLITTKLLNELNSEIDVKPDSFRFVMNKIKEVLNEV